MGGDVGDAWEREMVGVVRVAVRWTIGMAVGVGVEDILVFLMGSRAWFVGGGIAVNLISLNSRVWGIDYAGFYMKTRYQATSLCTGCLLHLNF